MFSSLNKTIAKVNLLIGYCSGLGILAMGIILFYEVIARYVFNSPTIWAQEVSIILFIWTMLAGAAYTLQVGKHVQIDLLTIRLSKKTQSFLELITSIIGMFFSAYVTLQGVKMLEATLKYHKLSATPLRVPLWIPQLALPVGFGLLTLQFIIIIAMRSAALKDHNKEGEQPC
ncbi:MAG: TRAP transporter small permease [Aminobacterium sp.]|uniref:TRAP transporter small permease subunit n=1 Tax=unclassified Aminobacterium TaxID=2685012 RepID=UPI001BD16D80|nr:MULTISPECIES: TRAP transporter small permease [unclassified Aminobacterium]MDD4229737.1 TRAP transporter small permease [Aminobacterium sp.]MEA4876704.1 TRAP transporter small permease [Aminobacterium sp.]WMI72195.1 TRAP transporter small permease [Aminobacterium sp. MB27-C1]